MIHLIPDVLDKSSLDEVRELVSAAEFVDGKKTAGYRAKRVKNNEQLSSNNEDAKRARQLVLDRLKSHSLFTQCCLPKMFSGILISKSGVGKGYGLHVDDAHMKLGSGKIRSDISVTTFLSDDEDYEGGELEIITPYGATRFKQPAGSVIAYPSKFLHQVRPVTKGERLVAVCWIQSHIRNEQDREILFELDQIKRKLNEVAEDAVETDLAFKVSANLQRRWTE
ncbi:MAG: Fe2+-dependent dioxygenase [Hyphomicrobiales bacterium]|nr:Fe2+-dependent dioxygenase [Hyphomicrobiales bacterium]